MPSAHRSPRRLSSLTGTAFGDVVVGFCFLVRPLFGFIQDDVDLAHFETGQLDVEFKIDQALKLDG